jgi:hypothetical protein
MSGQLKVCRAFVADLGPVCVPLTISMNGVVFLVLQICAFVVGGPGLCRRWGGWASQCVNENMTHISSGLWWGQCGTGWGRREDLGTWRSGNWIWQEWVGPGLGLQVGRKLAAARCLGFGVRQIWSESQIYPSWLCGLGQVTSPSLPLVFTVKYQSQYYCLSCVPIYFNHLLRAYTG